MAKNKLITFGWLSHQTAFLNVPEEEALARFMAAEYGDDFTESDLAQAKENMRSFEFDDQFYVYSAWGG